MDKDINRLKLVLTEKKIQAKWLAGKMQKDLGTISKRCTNTPQPSLVTMMKIARILGVDVRELIMPTRNDVVLQRIDQLIP